MFIRHALFGINTAEPWWFRLIRRTIAIIFVSVLFLYGFFQFRNLRNTPNNITIEPKVAMNDVNFPGFFICPGSIGPKYAMKKYKTIQDPQFSITCGRSITAGPEILSEYSNYTESECGSSFTIENGCLKFSPKYVKTNNESIYKNYAYDNRDKDILMEISRGLNRTFMFFNVKPLENATQQSPYYSIYFNEYQDGGDFYMIDGDNYSIEYNEFSIDNISERSILEYSICIHKEYSSTLMGQLNTYPDLYSMEFEAGMKNVQREAQTNELQFVLLPRMPHYMRIEMENYNYQPISVIVKLGGLYSAMSAFYTAFFGTSKVEPWGLVQMTLFRCWLWRRRFRRGLASKYISSAGIPLGEYITQGSNSDDRLQSLELLSRDYYLDSYYLKRLRLAMKSLKKRQIEHSRLELGLDFEEVSISTSPPSP